MELYITEFGHFVVASEGFQLETKAVANVVYPDDTYLDLSLQFVCVIGPSSEIRCLEGKCGQGGPRSA